ncbi:MAG: FtsX-like permease family protein [Bacteroidia bacterium]|nr:FtsX-like permease family protein [Bacteroidia bacterium]
MTDYQLAWKNLWRNKRRTIITAASIFFAVFFSLVMRSFQLGAYDRMFKNIIESYTGYLQIQHRDYFDEPTIDNSFELSQPLIDKIESDPNVNTLVPRLESFALAAAESRTQGVMVLGIDPEGEEKVTDLKSKLVKYKLTPESILALKESTIPARTKKLLDVFTNESYSSEGRLLIDLDIGEEDTASILPVLRRYASFKNRYLDNNETAGAIIGDGLSDYLKAGVGDTIVLVGQGYHGTSAAGKYEVRGIVRLPAPDIDNVIVYLPIAVAQELFAAPDMVTSAVLRLNNNDNENVLQSGESLRKLLNEPLTIRTWHELNALLINQMEADSRSGMIMIGILYLVIAFGVFGTVLMMMAERRREFGMLVSIGMRKNKLAKVVSFEMLLIGFLGLAAGVIASLPFVFYGNAHPIRFTGEMGRMYSDYGFEPIMPTLLPDTYYLWQIVVVLIILLIAILFSIRKIFRINVISALRA